EIDYTLEENEERVIAAIDAALARIDDGTFGNCLGCGRQIAAERLEAVPWTTQCIDCKRKEERG
ncbi:MAG: conjugal transfer protein TraR, partial [Actinobacteria bacterium]